MTKRPTASSRPSRLLIVGVWVAGIAAIGGIVGMVFIAIEKVRTGRGLDTYRTHWLMEFNWIGFLVFLAAVAVALAVGFFIRYKEWREIRKLQDKYPAEHPE